MKSVPRVEGPSAKACAPPRPPSPPTQAGWPLSATVTGKARRVPSPPPDRVVRPAAVPDAARHPQLVGRSVGRPSVRCQEGLRAGFFI